MRRFVLIAAAALTTALLVMPSVQASGVQKPAEFVSGTGVSIPAHTAGSLDTASPAELKFHYRGSVFSVPYQSVTDVQAGDPTGKHIWRVPVPKIGKSDRLLTISYRNADSTAMVTFKASASAVSSLLGTINERRQPAPEAANLKSREPVAPATIQEDWWGNHYWRTLRNKSKWPQSSEPQPAPTGTKE